ncbi:MAG: hypothetical protein ACOYMR_06735, partial [Ilumatobacteraceae bacterium]
YECLAGRVPFLGETDADTALARLNREATDLTRLRPTLPLGLAPLIHRLLARRPDERYATGAELRAELQRIAAQPKTDVDHSTELAATPHAPTTRSRTTGAVPTTPLPPPDGATQRVPSQRGGTTGSQPVVRAGRPAGTAQRADRTPPSTQRPQARPNRKFEQRSGPSMMVVGGLLVAAFVVGLVLWVTMGAEGGNEGTTENSAGTTVVPGQTTVPATAAPQPGGAITSVTTFDPDGDGNERDADAPLAIDGNPDTAWQTVCYGDKFLGGKGGVGLVADLGAPHTGTFTIQLGSAPYQLRVYTSAAAEPPASFDAWGDPRRYSGDQADTITVAIEQPARYVLVSFVQLGENNGCTDNPYRGSIRELTFG